LEKILGFSGKSWEIAEKSRKIQKNQEDKSK